MNRPLSLLALAALAGCSASDQATEAVGTATPTDSIVLQEPDSVALGTRTPVLLRTRDGRMFTFEFPGRRVSAYAADGRYLGELARTGDGPGELQLVFSGLLLADDSLLAVIDGGRSRVLMFNVADRTFLRESVVDDPAMPVNHGAMIGDRIVMPRLVGRTPLAEWDPREGTVTPWGELPANWKARGDPVLARSVVLPIGDRVFTLLPLDSIAHWRDANGVILDSMVVPARARRPLLPETKARHDAMERTQVFDQVTSWPFGGSRLSDNRPVVLFLDVDLDVLEDGTRWEIRWHQFYVTVLGDSPTTSCIDIPVDLPFDEMSWPTFTGDTLWVLDRTPGSGGAPRTMVRGMVIRCG
jgi:hypothetical protein